MNHQGRDGQGKLRHNPDPSFNLGLYGAQEGILAPLSHYQGLVYNSTLTVERFGPCACSVFCSTNGGANDTCTKHGIGCSSAGSCQCRKQFMGKHCNLPLVPTGEINQRNFKELGHDSTNLAKALFLVVKSACPLCGLPILAWPHDRFAWPGLGNAVPGSKPHIKIVNGTTQTVDAVALANILNLCGTAPAPPNSTFGSQEMAIWKQTYLWFREAKSLYEETKEAADCPIPVSMLFFNQFASLCGHNPLLVDAITRYAFHQMDIENLGQLHLRHLVQAELVQLGYVHWH